MVKKISYDLNMIPCTNSHFSDLAGKFQTNFYQGNQEKNIFCWILTNLFPDYLIYCIKHLKAHSKWITTIYGMIQFEARKSRNSLVGWCYSLASLRGNIEAEKFIFVLSKFYQVVNQ